MKSHPQETGANNFINILIIICVIIGATAPFWHIFFSKESTDKTFGFNNTRIFLYSIGHPLSLFILSIFVSFLSNLLELKPYKKAIKIGSYTFTGISVYFIVWTFWYTKDLNVYLYYSAIGIVSIVSSWGIYELLKSVTNKLKALNAISEQIPKLGSDIEYINGIADLMPENEDTVTYKAMLDTTGDDLRSTYKEIEKDLKESTNKPEKTAYKEEA